MRILNNMLWRHASAQQVDKIYVTPSVLLLHFGSNNRGNNWRGGFLVRLGCFDRQLQRLGAEGRKRFDRSLERRRRRNEVHWMHHHRCRRWHRHGHGLIIELWWGTLMLHLSRRRSIFSFLYVRKVERGGGRLWMQHRMHYRDRRGSI